MREHPADGGRAERDPGKVLLEAVVEVELPWSRRRITETAVKVFVIEPTRYCVSGVAGIPPSRSASPTVPNQTVSPADDAGRNRGQTLGLSRTQYPLEPRLEGVRRGKEPQCRRDQVDRLLDLVVVDVEMRDGTEDAGMDRGAQADAGLGEQSRGLGRREPERADVDLYEVRLHLVRLGGDTPLGPAFGEPVGPGVVVGEPLHVVLEGVETRRRDDPGLAHRTAEAVFFHASRAISSGVPAITAPSGQPRPLERQRSLRVSQAAHPGSGDAGGDRRVREPGAVEARQDREAACAGYDGAELSSGQTVPPALLCVFSRATTEARGR